MIEIQGLTFTYPGAEIPQLKKIDLTIEKGDFVAIVGNNGCGKSTLCKTLNGLIPHFITGDMEGKVLIDGIDTTKEEVGKLACKVGYVYQDFENQIVRPTVLDDASFACLNYGYEDYEERGKAAVRRCGLQGKTYDYVWQLSGGQKHLLALASTEALSPDVMILDEPIAQLDPVHAEQIYEVLKDLNENHGKTIIVIEHHTEFIAHYCKQVVLMKDGEVVWKKKTKEALQCVEVLQASNVFPPQVTLAAEKLMQAGKLPFGVLPTTLEEGKKTFRKLKYIGESDTSSSHHTKEINEKEINKKEVMMQFEDIEVAYRVVKGEEIKLMEHFNLTIHKGEKIALIGSNGAGKSTLMKMMLGCVKPSAGTIYLDKKPLKDIPFEALAREIALVYQNPEEMFIKDSIRGDVMYAMQVRDVEAYEKRTEELLARFRLESLGERDGRLLSGGQMRRASLAIGIALKPSILLLDEPTANLDIATRQEIMRTLQDLKGTTETIMIATHDMQLVCDWAERIIVLCQGKVVADGTREAIFSNEEVMEQVGIRPPAIYKMGRALDERAACYTMETFCERFREEKQIG